MEIKGSLDYHISKICGEIGSRPFGTDNNRKTGDYIKENLKKYGYPVELQEVTAFNWTPGNKLLKCGDKELNFIINPYSPSSCITSAGIFISNIKTLKNAELTNKLVIIYGDLSKEYITPKNFMIYNPERHQEINKLLEEKNPAAIICISHFNDLAVPIIEDPDIQIPSVTMTYSEGLYLINNRDKIITLNFETTRNESTAYNIIGKKPGSSGKKVSFCAHYDTKYYTEGYLDNGSGTAALLTLAEYLSEKNNIDEIEYIFFPSEECMAYGELKYIERYENDFEKIKMLINVDGAGYKSSCSTVVSFNFEEEKNPVKPIIDKYDTIIETEPWYASDHSMFLMKGVPSIAFSSTIPMTNITHTCLDNKDALDTEKLEDVVKFIIEMISYM